MAIQEPALVRIRVFWVETHIQTLHKVPGETIVDPRAVIFAKDELGLALRIPDGALPISSGSGEEQSPL